MGVPQLLPIQEGKRSVISPRERLIAQDEEQLGKAESAFRRVFGESIALEALIAAHMLLHCVRPSALAALLPFMFPATLLWSLVVTIYCFHWGQRLSRYRGTRAVLVQEVADLRWPTTSTTS